MFYGETDPAKLLTPISNVDIAKCFFVLGLKANYGGFLSPPQYAQVFGDPRSGRMKEIL